ncbi:MAG TPA: hypothetical protein VN038_25910, partial [Dyadobacter sp.]|jgi:hypothetical protein|nr:hypothetical protein [Dyadobacter sp.]
MPVNLLFIDIGTMEAKKRVITIYKNLNDPYVDIMLTGNGETPSERFDRFFEIRKKFELFKGFDHSTRDRTMKIRKAEWF